jgi:hypothetical protein
MRAPAIRDELLAMAAEDHRVRATLVADGSLFAGYHPAMEAVHRRNAARLTRILDACGWPGVGLVGRDGEEAAWLIVQHAIGTPDLMRRGLALLEAAVQAGEAPAWQPAFLMDRIRTLEGRPQLYGTQFDFDAAGELSPLPLEDPAGVDQRRQAIGLEPLATRTATLRAQAQHEGERPPEDFDRRQREMRAWAIAVGWQPSR